MELLYPYNSAIFVINSPQESKAIQHKHNKIKSSYVVPPPFTPTVPPSLISCTSVPQLLPLLNQYLYIIIN